MQIRRTFEQSLGSRRMSEGCPLKGQTMRMNRGVRFSFGGSTVLLASSGDPVSFNTTVGGVVFQFVKGNRVDMSHGIWRGA